MNFKLEKPIIEMENEYNDYINEWEKSEEKIVPYAARREGQEFKDLLNNWKLDCTDKAYEKGFVPSTLYFLLGDNKKIYGAIHIRHELNEYLLSYGGHIGYGIRPSERKKGYATLMLSLSLPIAKELGIKKALITCDKENTSSAKTIKNNGGVLENEIEQKGEITQRYWIEL